MKGTRIIIRALTEKAKPTIKESMFEDVKKRNILGKFSKKMLSDQQKDYLKTVSVFIPKDNPERHEILGFSLMTESQKEQFYSEVKKAFFEDKCTLEDFEVLFIDE